MARIILFGLAGAGKDTVAQMLLDKLAAKGNNVVLAKFATTLKQAAQELFGDNFDDRDVKEVAVHVPFGQVIDVCDDVANKLFGNSEETASCILKAIDVFGELLVNGFLEISPRKFQQLLGTEVVRSIEENAWANKTAEETANPNYKYIITDGRFENELLDDAILVYIFRPKVDKELVALKEHASEAFNLELYNKAVIADTSILLNHADRDFYILDNLGDLEELEMNVETFLEGL